jgi:hypothetical protein
MSMSMSISNATPTETRRRWSTSESSQSNLAESTTVNDSQRQSTTVSGSIAVKGGYSPHARAMLYLACRFEIVRSQLDHSYMASSRFSVMLDDFRHHLQGRAGPRHGNGVFIHVDSTWGGRADVLETIIRCCGGIRNRNSIHCSTAWNIWPVPQEFHGPRITCFRILIPRRPSIMIMPRVPIRLNAPKDDHAP